MRNLILGLGIMILYSSTVAAMDERGLVAYYTFEEGSGQVLKDKSGNKNDAKIIGPTWVKGKDGAALDFDPGQYVDCGGNNSLRPMGPVTLAVWVKRISNVEENVISFHTWNVSLGRDGTPFVTAPLAAQPGKTEKFSAESPVPLNEWAFIATVYDPERQIEEIYINGELNNSAARTERPWDPRGLFRSKVYLGSGQFSGLIGGFRAYMRALSSDEIKTLFQSASLDRGLESASYRAVVTPHLLYSNQKVVAEVSLSGPRRLTIKKEEPLKEITAELTLCKAGKRSPILQQTVGNLAQLKKASVTFSTAGLKPGLYEIWSSAKMPDGKLIASEPGYMTFPEKPWWFNSKAGISDEVLPPYTPMKVQSGPGELKQVECWGRSYEFDAAPFPKQITTAGRAILAEPIRLSARVDGRDIIWKGGAVQLIKESPAKVMLRHSFSDAALTFTSDVIIEYDGMIRADCKIVPLRKCSLEKLTLEIPLKQEHATLQYQCRDGLFNTPGVVPPEGIVRSFNPAIWLGDEERGLQWFADSDQYWLQEDKNRAIEIVRDGGKVTLRLNIISKAVELTPDKTPQISYDLGLEATPLQPITKDYWDYRWASAPRYGHDYALLTDKIAGEPLLDRFQRLGVKTIMLLNWTEAVCYNMPYGHYKDFGALVKAIHSHGMQAIPYVGFQFSELAPECESFKDDFLSWETETPYFHYHGGYENYPGDMPSQRFYGPCVRSGWVDMSIAQAARCMDEYDVDGFYCDNGGIGHAPCYNTNHPGCGKLIRLDGSSTQAGTIFEGRELMRRLYQVVKSRKPDGQVDLHRAGFLHAPIMAWTTGFWDGETVIAKQLLGRNPEEGEYLLSYLPLAGFRAVFMGSNWGLPGEFLDYNLHGYSYARQFALTLLHDVPIRCHIAGDNLKFQSALWKVMDEFGRKQAEWLPYWKNSEFVSVTPADAYVSLYRHPKNGVLAVVSNLTKEKAQVNVTFALDKLGLSGKSTAINALTKEPISIKNGKITLDLDSVDWKLVWVKP